MKQLYRALVAMAAALIAILATGNARADMPDNTFGTVGTADDGSYLVEVGRGVSVDRVVSYYDKVYRAATSNDKAPDGEPLTWGVIHAQNEGRVIPYCSKPKNGPRWLPTRSNMVWNECDESDRSIILIAGPSGRIKVPVKAVETFAQMQARVLALDTYGKSLGCKRSDVACFQSKIGSGGTPPAPETPATPAVGSDANDQPDAGSAALPNAGDVSSHGSSSTEKKSMPQGVEKPSVGFTWTYSGIPIAFALAIGFAGGRIRRRAKKPLNPREVETQKSLKPPSAEKLGINVPNSPWVAPVNGNGAHAVARSVPQPVVAPATVAIEHGLQTVTMEPQDLLPELMQSTPDSPNRYKVIAKLNGKSKANGANGHALPPASPEPKPRAEDLHVACRQEVELAEAHGVAELSRFREKALAKLGERDNALTAERAAHATTKASFALTETRITTLSEEIVASGRRLVAANAQVASVQIEVAQLRQRAENQAAEVVRLKGDCDKLSAIRETYSNADSVQSNIYLALSLEATVGNNQFSLHRDGGQTEKGEASFRSLINERDMAKASLIRSLAAATNRDDDSVTHLFDALFRSAEDQQRSDIPASSDGRYEESGPLRLPTGVAQPPLPAIEGSAGNNPERDVAGEEYLRRHTDPNADAAKARRIDTKPLRFGDTNAVVSEDEPAPVPSLSAPMGEFPGAQRLLAASSDVDDAAPPVRVSKVPTLVPPPPPTVRTPTSN